MDNSTPAPGLRDLRPRLQGAYNRAGAPGAPGRIRRQASRFVMDRTPAGILSRVAAVTDTGRKQILLSCQLECSDSNFKFGGPRPGPDPSHGEALWAFRLGAVRDSERRVQPRQTDAVDPFVAREA